MNLLKDLPLVHITKKKKHLRKVDFQVSFEFVIVICIFKQGEWISKVQVLQEGLFLSFLQNTETYLN